MKYIAFFGTSALTTLALLGYAWTAHGEKLLEPGSITGPERPGLVRAVAESCTKASDTERYSAAIVSSYCDCYADKLLSSISMSELKSIADGMTPHVQIKVDRATRVCRAKLSIAGR